jgi:hypothetical protein
MNGKTGIGLGAVVLLVLKLAFFATRHHTPAYTPPRSYPVTPAPVHSGSTLGDDLADFRAEQEKTIERHCRASTTTYLEPQGTQAPLFRALRMAAAPPGAGLPRAAPVLGLQALALGSFTDGTVCVDTDDAFVRQLADTHEGPAASALTELGPGAWLLQTQKEIAVPASTALVSTHFLARLKTRGALVAFAPTDHQVAFADASSPEAIRLAARKLAAIVDVTGESGLAYVEPLVFESGQWRPWKPPFAAPELGALAAMAAEVNAAQTADLLADVATFAQAARFGVLPGYRPGVSDAPVKTTRTFDPKGGATVDVESGALEAQAIGRAARVRLGGTTVSWSHFASTAGAVLVPATLDGQTIEGVFVLAAGFRWPHARIVAGN